MQDIEKIYDDHFLHSILLILHLNIYTLLLLCFWTHLLSAFILLHCCGCLITYSCYAILNRTWSWILPLQCACPLFTFKILLVCSLHLLAFVAEVLGSFLDSLRDETGHLVHSLFFIMWPCFHFEIYLAGSLNMLDTSLLKQSKQCSAEGVAWPRLSVPYMKSPQIPLKLG